MNDQHKITIILTDESLKVYKSLLEINERTILDQLQILAAEAVDETDPKARKNLDDYASTLSTQLNIITNILNEFPKENKIITSISNYVGEI